ncbi:MAG: SdpI family protein [Bacillaceae bacterium]|nr:SdpI family protein [Bacillaceae bacterium]
MTHFIPSLIFLFAGIILFIFPPKNINPIYGYRTKTSMKNISNWNKANKYSSKLLIFFGILLLVLSVFINKTIVIMILIAIVIALIYLLVEWEMAKVK